MKKQMLFTLIAALCFGCASFVIVPIGDKFNDGAGYETRNNKIEVDECQVIKDTNILKYKNQCPDVSLDLKMFQNALSIVIKLDYGPKVSGTVQIANADSLIILIDGQRLVFTNPQISNYETSETAEYMIKEDIVKKILDADIVELKIIGEDTTYITGRLTLENKSNLSKFYYTYIESKQDDKNIATPVPQDLKQ